jgi:Family of unknown function (DUF5681)
MAKTSPPNPKPPGGPGVGYGRPPIWSQFKPGKSGNPHGRPKGQPSIEEILLEEAARLVKIKSGDDVTHISKERAVVRAMLDKGARGDVAAARIYIALRYRAQFAAGVEPEVQQPLTADELELLKAMTERMQAKGNRTP